jgi:hypothetical protein
MCTDKACEINKTRELAVRLNRHPSSSLKTTGKNFGITIVDSMIA